MVLGGNGTGTIDTVQVALRVRPLMQEEIGRGCEGCIDLPGQNQVVIKDYAYTYNYVFQEHINQQEFYDTAVKGLIGKLFQGYNVTILAYGQTGSGKTYTMGTSYSGADGDYTKLGVIPQSVADIFDFIQANEDNFIFKVNVSFMELYQEQCYDLLSGKERGHSIIEIREDNNKGVILPGLTEVTVTSTTETMIVLEQGSSGRVTGSTAMNQSSSRSHAIFTIAIYKESRTDKNLATTSKFHLVDLAGSERLKNTKARGDRLKESVKINQSLLALGNVISALGDGTNRRYINYRDNKLTRLLQDSLGGNSLTLMVACVSPADCHLDETVSTLRYADRARRIRNKPIINQDTKAAEIVRLHHLVNELRIQMLDRAPTDSEQNNEKLVEEIEREKAKYADLLTKHKQVTEHLGNMLIENAKLCGKALLAEAARDKIDQKLNELTEQCNRTIDNLNASENDECNKTVLDSMKEIKTRLEDLQSVNFKTNEELINYEMEVLFATDEGEKGEVAALSEDQAVLEEEKWAMGQVALTQELQNLNRAIAIKAYTVQTILARNKDMQDSHDHLKQNEDRIAALEKEREPLVQELRNNKSKCPSREERRTKLKSLNAEIGELKEKCKHQASVIQNKEENEAKLATFQEELKAMKTTKVKIIRQICDDSEKFRKWKAVNERAMLRLSDEDRKRANAMAEMESLHAKQQSVLKRKMEEAVAVNKRLKEALDRQKQTRMMGSAKGKAKAGAVQQYIEQELEVQLSIAEAEKSLEELMEYRTFITEQIEYLRAGDNDENRQKIAELEDNLALRKAQISDLQQKILTADQENNSRTQWDIFPSMNEAKATLKCLFDLTVEAKKELQNQSEKAYQARYEEVKEAHDRLVVEFENTKTDLKLCLANLKQSEQKLAALVVQQHDLVCNKREACQDLQHVIQIQQEKLRQIDAENIMLSDELLQLRTAATNANVKLKNINAPKIVEYVIISDDEEEAKKPDDDDWPATSTPLINRIHAQRRAMNSSVRGREREPGVRSREREPRVRSRERVPGVRSRERELGVRSRDREPGMRSREREPRVRSREPELGVRSREREPGVRSREREPGVRNRERQPRVRSREREPRVRSRDPEPGVRSRERVPGVRSRERELGVRSRDREPGMRSREREPCVRSREREPGVRNRERQPRVRSREREPAVRSRERQPRVRSREREPRVRSREPEPGVRSREREPGVRSRERELGVRSRERVPGVRSREREPCMCLASCSTRICACVKAGSSCGDGCRCKTKLCKNKKALSDSEEVDKAQTSGPDTAPPSFSGNALPKLKLASRREEFCYKES